MASKPQRGRRAEFTLAMRWQVAPTVAAKQLFIWQIKFHDAELLL